MWETKLGKLYCGDCLEILKELENESIDMCITSPPYYGLRLYLPKDHPDYKKQLGLEDSFEEFQNRLLIIMTELKRVIKKSGSIWWNMGDTYGGSGMDMSYAGKTCGPNSILDGKLDKFPNTGHSRGIMDKCMLMMPERFAIKCVDELGLILRQKIVWCKQLLLKKQGYTVGSAMPTSAPDRFNMTWEYLYHFTKGKKYYSNLDAVRIPNQVLGVTDFRASGFVRSSELYPNSKYANAEGQGKIDGRAKNHIKQSGQRFNYRVRDAEKKQNQYPQFKATEEEITTSQIALKYGYNPEELCPVCGRKWKRHASVNSPDRKAGLRREFIPCVKIKNQEGFVPYEKAIGKSWGDHSKDLERGAGTKKTRALHPNGKNIPTVWQINPEPHNFSKELKIEIDHFAAFPQSLIDIPIKFSCPTDGIALDPFIGAGTTALVCEKLNRKWIGIELSSHYVELIKKRLIPIISQEKFSFCY